MKAIRVNHHGGPEQLRIVDLPVPEPGPGEVRVKATVAGLNYIDVYIRTGGYPHDLPLVPGLEGAGVIDAVGPGVSAYRPGQRVAYVRASDLGAYAQYVLVPVAQVVEIPDGIDDRTACALMLQGTTARYLVTETYAVKPGDTILAHAAAGGVGLLLVQLAKLAGAKVIATAGGAAKVALAREAGADTVIDYRTEDFAPVVRRLTADRGVPVVYDAVGKETWERSLSVLARRGLLVIYGWASGPVPPIDPQRLAPGSLYLTRPSLFDYLHTRDELVAHTDALFALVAAGKLRVRIGATYPLEEAAQAHRDLEARRTTGKILLTT